MSITLQPELAARLRERAKQEGITVEAYIDHLVRFEDATIGEIERLAVEGMESGDPIEADNDSFWEERRLQLDRHVKA